MKLISKAAVIPQLDWRSGETLLRFTAFLAAIAVIGAAILLYDHINFPRLGYTSVAVSALLASGGLLLPVPALVTACAASTFLVPVFVGLVAGTAETVGELTGYFLGYSGRGFVSQGRVYQRLESWMRRRGWLLMFILSVVPNPAFDLAGIAAGAVRFPLWAFLGVVLVGKVMKFVGLAYACAYSINELTRLFL